MDSRKKVPQGDSKGATAKVSEKTSWGAVADWYDTYLEVTPESYQAMVIAPNLLRVLALKMGERVIDIACGQGYFTRQFAEAGAQAIGADISKELIAAAKKRSPKIEYHVALAHQLPFAASATFDVATIVLAIQNIENITETFAEAHRVLKAPSTSSGQAGGRLVLVMNHPVFRSPKRTSWGWDEAAKVQYRRVDGYLSAAIIPIEMHPGQSKSVQTVSYHRSLQDFFKALNKAGFAVTKLEEWISHKKSEKGPKQAAEDTARKEIPLFLMLEARKI
jgi:ubiquinone/menaquinone biosynthesis C-methylase UbiE